jgi:trk system potassium uptake protein TrkA
MKIAIVGGGKKVDFLANSLLNKGHQLTIINDTEPDCKYFARTHEARVVFGDGSKPFILEDAGVTGFDLMIALTPKDADNLVICQLAKKRFGIKRAFSVVSNPVNVEVFKMLGINTVVSATYILAMTIEQMAFVDQLSNYLPLENGKVQLFEIYVQKEYGISGKQISEINFPDDAIIGCIIRAGNVIVPNGRTELRTDDKLIILTNAESHNKVLESLVGGSNV